LGRWWVAGGWAIDAFTGTARAHGDLDIGIPRSEAQSFIEFVDTILEVWAAAGSLTPLPPDGSSVPEGCGNLWLRASGADPWEYEVLLGDVREQTRVYKRSPPSRGPSAIVCGPVMASVPTSGDSTLAQSKACPAEGHFRL
jgi:hypothetical protein